MNTTALAIMTAALALTSLDACKGSEPVGMPCKAATDCYSGVDQTKIKGTVMCLDKVTGGYCTHLCQKDADCCAVSGECPSNHTEVCAPFESTGQMMCFLSCESDALDGTDANAYCGKYAGDAFSCRSTGGGSQNRMICSP